MADVLHNAWMICFAGGNEIDELVRTQLLTLDDVPNSLGLQDGTPHWADIDLGFADQGFPRDATLATGIAFTGVMDPGQTTDETGPYEIRADIKANFAGPIQSANLYYRVNGGAFSSPVTMTQDEDTFTGTIPGQTAPAVIEYYLTAEDSMAGYSQTGQTAEYPVSIKVAMDATPDQYGDDHDDIREELRYEAGEATPTYGRFFVGVKNSLFFDGFEDPPGDWTHDEADDGWEFGTPTGEGHTGLAWSDPDTAYNGDYCAGIDLGEDDGAYSHDADNWLRTRTIEGLDENNPTFLRFQRWLSVDRWRNQAETFLDFAEICVIADPDGTPSETIVWKNHRAVKHIDNATSDGDWVAFEIEITDALVKAEGEIQVEWRLRSDPITAGPNDLYGGWTIDDVEVFSIEPVP